MAKNWDLLRETRDYIVTHPEDWDQDQWRCATGMCFAGWAATLAGKEWADDVRGTYFTYSIADPDYSGPAIVRPYGDRRMIPVSSQAEYQLGLTPDESSALFHYDNDLATINGLLHAWAMKEDWSEAYLENEVRDAVTQTKEVVQ